MFLELNFYTNFLKIDGLGSGDILEYVKREKREGNDDLKVINYSGNIIVHKNDTKIASFPRESDRPVRVKQ